MTSENTIAAAPSPIRTAIVRFSIGLVLGFLVLLACNAVSYLVHSATPENLLGGDQGLAEAWGFPFCCWRESNLHSTWRETNPGELLPGGSAATWNLLVAIGAGLVCGLASLISGSAISRLFAAGETSSRDKLTFQFSLSRLILLMTVTSLVIAVPFNFDTISRRKVESSNLATAGHNAFTATMEVEFRNGSVYRYHDVPYAEYRKLLDADSIGRHFNRVFREWPSYERRNNKSLNPVLVTIYLAGPLIAIALALMFDGVAWPVRFAICFVAMIGLATAAVYGQSDFSIVPLRRVFLGLFVFWAPQFVFGGLLAVGVFCLLRSMKPTRPKVQDEA